MTTHPPIRARRSPAAVVSTASFAAIAAILAAAFALSLTACGIPIQHTGSLVKAEIEGRKFRNNADGVGRDIAYGGDDNPERKLDVYRAQTAKPAPVFVFVHGGSWQSGGRDEYGALGETLRAQSIVTVNVDYRLAPKTTYPDFADDVVDALNWVMAHISEYGGDPDRVIVAGHSAGAHLVAITFLNDRFRSRMTFDPQRVKGLILMGGAYDLRKGTSVGDKVIMLAMKTDENLADAEPMTHVRADIPPVLIVHGTKDNVTYEFQATLFADALRRAGATVKYDRIEGADHYTLLIDMLPDNEGPAFRAVIGFVESCVYQRSPATGQ